MVMIESVGMVFDLTTFKAIYGLPPASTYLVNKPTAHPKTSVGSNPRSVAILEIEQVVVLGDEALGGVVHQLAPYSSTAMPTSKRSALRSS